jgi:tripartite-type tricarboxylate transporter receptor subunit TctC
MKRREFLQGSTAAVFLASALAAPGVRGQTYPDRAVKLLVPFIAGGSPDVITRVLAEHLQKSTGQSFVVENRGGANGIPGLEAVARSKADGYTVLSASTSPLTVNPALYPNLPYDTLRDFDPVIFIGQSTLVMMVNPLLPAKSAADLVNLAKAQPGKLTFGSAGNGNLTHLVAELFKIQTRTNLLHVPYKGTAQVYPDLIAGRVDVLFDTAPAALPQIKAGTVRPLAVTTTARSAALPDLPTLAETGLVAKDFDVSAWFAMLAPHGTPVTAIERLNAEVNKALADPAVKERLATLGVEAVGGPADALRAKIASEIPRWREVVRVADIKVQ